MLKLYMNVIDTYTNAPWTCMFRWADRSFNVLNKKIKEIKKYNGLVVVEHDNPVITGNIHEDTKVWIGEIEKCKKWAGEKYNESCLKYDFLEAEMYKDINIMVSNELFYMIKRFLPRITNIPNTDIGEVNKIVHDYFMAHPECGMIDLSV